MGHRLTLQELIEDPDVNYTMSWMIKVVVAISKSKNRVKVRSTQNLKEDKTVIL